MKTIILHLLAFLVLTGCAGSRGGTNAPLLDTTLPIEATAIDTSNPHPLIIEAASTFTPYEVVLEDITFIVGVDETNIIRYVATADSDFITPEGVGPATRVVDTIGRTAGPIRIEGDLSCMLLPSGWWAVHTIDALDEQGVDATIEWLYFQ